MGLGDGGKGRLDRHFVGHVQDMRGGARQFCGGALGSFGVAVQDGNAGAGFLEQPGCGQANAVGTTGDGHHPTIQTEGGHAARKGNRRRHRGWPQSSFRWASRMILAQPWVSLTMRWAKASGAMCMGR